MLSSVSLRICWVATMAPALTEAANQADNFTLTSPAEFSVNLNFVGKGKSDFTKFSFMTLGQLASSCKAKSFESSLSKLEEQLVEASAEIVPTDLQWNDANVNLRKICNAYKKFLQYERNSNCLKLSETSPSVEQSFLQGIQSGPCKLNDHKHTMSKNITHFQDTMGLLNANTSLDSELKCKLSDDCKQSAFSSHEQMLLFSDPGKQRCADIDIPLEVDEEKLQTEVGEALLKKLVSANSSRVKKETTNEPYVFQWTALPKVENPETKIELMETCYASLRSRSAQIIRRIRKLQLQQTESHTSEQLKLLKDNRNKLLNVPPKRIQHKLPSQLRLRKAEELLQSKEVKGLTTTALVDLVKVLESGNPLKDVTDVSSEKEDVKTLEDKKELNWTQDICKIAGSLRGVIEHLESTIEDSDVTDSSSGGESGDEAPSLTTTHRGKLSTNVHKRSYWRWTIDRAAIATRWVWLQAQISDLEYKIRQQNEVYRQFRLAKGGITFVDRKWQDSEATGVASVKVDNQLKGAEPMNPSSGTLSSAGSSANHLENSILASRLHKNANGFWPPEKAGNGYISKVGNESSIGTNIYEKISEDPELSAGDVDSSRTRPLKCFKKRKLVRTLGLHYLNRKVSKLASVRCHCNCQRNYLPCIICGGRYNSTQSVDPDIMSFAERVGLLDSSFHPRLSLKHETQTGIQYENLLRKSKYQRSRVSVSGMKRRKRGNAPSYSSISNQARKHSQKLTRNAAQTLLLSSKRTRRSSLDGTKKRLLRERKTEESIGAKKIVVESNETDNCRKISERSCSFSSTGSKPCSPSPSPLPPINDTIEFLPPNSGLNSKVGGAAADIRRRRLDDAYDINNIVIPYSIASATRLEKLQYKEILTPKWRVVEESLVSDPAEEEIEEDISDELYALRHLKCEEDERKKFMTYISVPGRSRSRSTRMDRADSSGANTPDPMSPAQTDFLVQESLSGWNSPVASPPPPPAGWQLELETSLAATTQPASICTRRRTISLTKRTSEDERHHQAPFTPVVTLFGDLLLPYEVRTFPLPEEEYHSMVKGSSHLEEKESEYGNAATPVEGSSNGSPQAVEDDPNDPEWVTSALS